MEPRLTDINRQEALEYLGYKGTGVPEDVGVRMDRCCRLLLETARPRAAWRMFPWDPDAPLPGTGFSPGGADIRRMLRESHHVILFGATLGSEVEQLIQRTQVRDMTDGLILDCCASAAIENVCDNLCEDLQSELEGFLTDRFSPGYGDFPLSQQPDFFQVLNLSRRIGVQLSASGLMIPQKSVTALMGLADTPQPKRFRGCAYCSLFEHCSYRKEGTNCGRI